MFPHEYLARFRHQSSVHYSKFASHRQISYNLYIECLHHSGTRECIIVMTDEERAGNPLASEIRTSCMNSIDLIDYFTQVMGISAGQLLNGLRVDAEFLHNAANWIDNFDTYKLYRNCHHAAAGFLHKDWYEVGQASHANDAAGYFRIILKLVSTDKIYARIPTLISRTSKVSQYQLISASRGHVRLRYEIPDETIRRNYTIAAECWYHLGALSAVPRIQSESAPLAVGTQEICSMSMGHILEDCYRLRPSDYSYSDEGIAVFGHPVARWVRLHEVGNSPATYSGDYDLTDRVDANALLVIKDLRMGNRVAFAAGEIYEAPHCLFDIEYQTPSLARRLGSVSRLRRGYYEQLLKKTEELYLEVHRLRDRERRLERILESAVDGESLALVEPEQLPDVTPTGVGLTRREREITERISQGMTNKEIADALFISTETVKRHVYNIYNKAGVRNRVQLVRTLSGNPPALGMNEESRSGAEDRNA